MKKTLHKSLVLSTFIACSLHAEELTIDTGINTAQLHEDLSLDEMLTILSAGKLMALVYTKPEVTVRLKALEMALDAAYEKAVIAALAKNRSVDELMFKQIILRALYASLYKKVQQEVTDHGTPEQEIMFTQQLSPDELQKFFAK